MLISDINRYILFEKQDSQGNQWNEVFLHIEPVKNDFQIIFEARGANSLISDIAIDDVALMKDGDCMQFLTTETITEEAEGIYGMQSCANRCSETQSIRANGNKTLIVDDKIIEKCDCHQECLDLDTCCTDYQLICLESKNYFHIVVQSLLLLCNFIRYINEFRDHNNAYR